MAWNGSGKQTLVYSLHVTNCHYMGKNELIIKTKKVLITCTRSLTTYSDLSLWLVLMSIQGSNWLEVVGAEKHWCTTDSLNVTNCCIALETGDKYISENICSPSDPTMISIHTGSNVQSFFSFYICLIQLKLYDQAQIRAGHSIGLVMVSHYRLQSISKHKVLWRTFQKCDQWSKMKLPLHLCVMK